MAQVNVLDTTGKKADSIDLPEEIFDGKVNMKVIYQAIQKYRASSRQGTANTKERTEVRGTSKKPHRQKGTGRARAGSVRSPLWTGGGVTFGPHPRDFSYTIPKKIKQAALRESLKAKHKNENLVCVIDLKNTCEKTKEFAEILKALKLKGRILAVLDGSDESVKRVSNNIPRFQLKRAQDVNALDILNNKNLLVSKSAFEQLILRVRK